MKKSRFTTLWAITLLFVFATGATAAGPAPLQIKITWPSIAVGGLTLVTLTGGTPPYAVTSSRSDVAPLSCNQPPTSCTAKGTAAGVTALVVRDSKGVTSRADLTVAKPAPMSTMPNSSSMQQMNAAQQAQQDEQQRIWAEKRKAEQINSKNIQGVNAVQKIETPQKKVDPKIQDYLTR
jgi:hypothetical protein